MGLRIALAGQVGIEADGTAVEGSALGRLGRLALAYLVSERHRPVSHAELAELLWRDDLPRSWEQLVRGTVAKLRGAFRDVGLVPSEVLSTGFGCYQLHLPPDSEVDVEVAAAATDASRDALAEGDAARAQAQAALAAAIASRQFVPGGAGPWVERRQADVRELHLRSLEALADAANAAGDWAAAVSAADAAIVVEPFRESAYQRLMAAHAGLGNRAAALRAYERCRQTLAEELGVNPSPTTEEAYLELLGEEPAPVTPSSRGPAEIPLPAAFLGTDRGPFVGRDQEVAGLEDALERARAQGVQAVLVAGEPGIGKTRLATELARVVHALGATVLHGRCDDELGVPYQPFAEALSHYVRHASTEELTAHVSAHGSVIARLTPELGRRFPDLPPAPSVDDETDRYRMFEAVVALLGVAAEGTGLVLVLDDLHWAAKPTLLLLRHLLRSNTHAPVLVLGTYRDTELAWSHPLGELLADLRQSASVERLLLWGLDRDAVAALLKAVDGDRGFVADDGLLDRLQSDTDGNPFFVSELIRHLVESDDHSLGVPQSVREVLRRRLTRLSPGTAGALSVAAVVGSDFSLALVEEASEDTGDALAALEQAVSARLIVEHPHTAGRFQFAHALIRHALYEDLGRARRARLHLAVGRSLQSLAGDDDAQHVVALAHHFCEAVPEGEATVAADYASRASRQALEQLAYEDAVLHAQRGLAALDQAAEHDADRRCTLLLLIGAARMRIGDNEGMRSACRAAAEEARALSDAERFGQAVAMHNFLLPLDLKELGAVLVEEALAGLGEGFPAVRAQVMAARACDMLTHREAETEEAARDALELARNSGDPDALWRALLVMNCGLWGSPRIHERLALADEFMARSAPGWHQAHAHRIRSTTRYVAGDVAGALDDARAMHRLAAELRMTNILDIEEITEVLAASLDGHFAGIDAKNVAGEGMVYGAVMLQTFEVRRAQGRLAEWLPTLEATAQAHKRERAFRGQRTLARALTGRVDDARSDLDAMMAEKPDVYWGWSRPHSYAYMAEAAVVLQDADVAGVLGERLRPYSGQLIGPSCCPGSVDRYLGLVAAAREGWDEAEAYFEGAVAFEGRLGFPLLLPRTRVCYARMLLTRGRPGDRDRAAGHLTAALGETESLDMGGLRSEAADLLARL